jgi:hypothetical protein
VAGCLRARTPAGTAQEAYALLTCYQILRIAITDAIEAVGAGWTLRRRPTTTAGCWPCSRS